MHNLDVHFAATITDPVITFIKKQQMGSDADNREIKQFD